MEPQLALIDKFIILGYLFLILIIGFISSPKKNSDDYIFIGRKLSIFPFTISLVATWYGGILGVGEFTFKYGISNWFVFGFPYYIFAILFAIFFAKKINQDEIITIPDRLRKHYGNVVGFLSALIITIISSPAPYILSCSILLNFLFEIPIIYSIVISTLISMIYIYKNGFRSIIRTDIIQFVFMFLGFLCLILFCIKDYGGINKLYNNLPESHFNILGEHSIQYFFVWFFIGLWTFIDPNFYQRCISAKNNKTAKYGVLLSVVFWMIFDFITLLAGLYSAMIITENINEVLAFPYIGVKILPPFIKGIFFVGLLSTIMSTIDSMGFISSVTIGRDFFWRITQKYNEEIWTKISLPIIGLISIFLVFFFSSIIEMWYFIGSIFIPGILIPFIITFSKKLTIRFPIITIISPIIISIFWIYIGKENDRYILDIEPFFMGLIISLLFVILFTKSKDIK